MHYKNLFLFMGFIVLNQNINAQQSNKSRFEKIIVEGQISSDYSDDSIELRTIPSFHMGYTSDELQIIRKKTDTRYLKWELTSSRPIDLFGAFFGETQTLLTYTAEPGDSIHLNKNNGDITFSGKGSAKFQLVYELEKINKKQYQSEICKELSYKNRQVTSLNDYLGWNYFLNENLNLMTSLIDSYKGKISEYAYNLIKVKVSEKIEEKRCDKFKSLRLKPKILNDSANPRLYANKFGLTEQDLNNIFDSTLNGPAARWLQYQAPLVYDPYYLYAIVHQEIDRQNGFYSAANGNTAGRFVSYYELAKRKYKGLIRESVLAFVFYNPTGGIKNAGFAPQMEKMLANYYNSPGYPEYKSFVKDYELQQRALQLKQLPPNFALSDTSGKSFTYDRLKGKIILFDFWFTGCTGCVQMAEALNKVEEEFKIDTNLLFINVSVDKNKKQWINSILQKKYTTGRGVNLYTDGEGDNHKIVKYFAVDGYPSLRLIDPSGKIIIINPIQDPRRSNAEQFIKLLKKQLVYMKDGPYVFHDNNSITSFSILGSTVTTKKFNESTSPCLRVQTDQFNNTFSFSLKRSDLHNRNVSEPTIFERPEKLFGLSDIEGNFDAFRGLLQANKIIDENYNWTFGKGHLVFTGDMFDRGNQVTECLWLIYSLEEKAKSAGGYVHFILGNHEVLNIQGHYRYVQQKYNNNADLLGKSLMELYNRNSELGRWLRTKNIVEKIGDMLFVHGGFGKEFTDSVSLPLPVINELFRSYVDSSNLSLNDNSNVRFIFSSNFSPFWYRNYYKQGDSKIISETDETKIITIKRPSSDDLEFILNKWQVNRIITGHTIVGDTISSHYGGKVINLDTKHAEGKSEALLIENNRFYRVNIEGKRLLLFKESNEYVLNKDNITE